jgi:hypothetical protein
MSILLAKTKSQVLFQIFQLDIFLLIKIEYLRLLPIGEAKKIVFLF